MTNRKRRFSSMGRRAGAGVVVILSLLSGTVAGGSTNEPEPRQVIRLGSGVQQLSNIILSGPNALLIGAGKGITILVAPDGVLCTGTNPIIRDLTIVGSGRGVGITLRNTWSAQIQDVAVESFATGIRLELNEEGRKQAGVTQRGWPSALTPAHWGSRMTLTALRDIDITGQGDGLVMYNLLTDGNRGIPGEFFTATTLWGGHIAVQGRAVVVGDNVWNTTFIGTYLDIGPGGGIYMDEKSWDLRLIGVVLDLSSSRRKAGVNKVFAASHKAAKSITYVATTLEENEIGLNNKGFFSDK